ncbi:MAG: phospholipase [Rhodoferax sp.]|nr:phospholipase [Rhodoferax sp.]
MKALCIYAGPAARKVLAAGGMQPSQVATIPAAAGGPKGLVLGALDKFLFGEWLPRATQPIHLVGASIGAWRMATACMDQPVAAFERLAHDYAHQEYLPLPGERRVRAEHVSQVFANNLQSFFGGHTAALLRHPRYRLHLITARGRHLLRTEHPWRTPVGYAGAFVSNAVRRACLGHWLERVVFSSSRAQTSGPVPLPFDAGDYRTRHVQLTERNFFPALQASCSIPFVMRAVQDVPGGPTGAYWDGGITDYHLHLNFPAVQAVGAAPSLVVYPHFQQQVIAGWLDKHLPWRHASSPFLDTTVVLAPSPEWIRTLPHQRLPDRTDFHHYGADLAARVRAWSTVVRASEQLADEFAQWLERPDMARVQAL